MLLRLSTPPTRILHELCYNTNDGSGLTAPAVRGSPTNIVTVEVSRTLRRQSIRKAQLVSKGSKSQPLYVEGSFYAPTGQKFLGEPRILAWDIETSPVKGHAFGVREVDIFGIEENTRIISFAYRWLHHKQTHVVSLRSFKPYTKGFTNEKKLLKVLWRLLDAADILVHQNGNSYDYPLACGRFLQYRLPPPRHPGVMVDTFKLMSMFRPDSRGQDNFSRQYGTVAKLRHHGRETWLGCIRGDHKEWDVMEAYNKRDVEGLVANYELMLPWLLSKPNRRRAIIAKGYEMH